MCKCNTRRNTAVMSSIFDNVDFATSRRKNKVLDTGQVRDLFGGHSMAAPPAPAAPSSATSTLMFADTLQRQIEIQYSKNVVLPHQHPQQQHQHECTKDLSQALPSRFSPCDAPASLKIDMIWLLCVTCTLFPVFAAVYKVVLAPLFTPEMLTVPYQCNLFYFGLFCGLPGITVHIFCLSLIFHQLCRSGVVMSLLSTFFMIVAIEHACMIVPTISKDSTFYLMALSVFFGLLAQGFFIAILYNESKQKRFYIGMLGVALVLVVLSVLSIVLSVLNSETPHTKPTVLVRIVPLSIATIIYAFSTYWTLFPVRVVCNNM